MDRLIPDSVRQKLDIDQSGSIFLDSLLLLRSGLASEGAQSVVSELLLNAANRASAEGGEKPSTTSVTYFRPCEVVNLGRLHIHSTPPFDLANWDVIRFYDKPTEDSLISYFSQIHLTHRVPDLIVIEQLDRIIGSECEDFLARLHALTSLFTDGLEHLQWLRSSSKPTPSSNAPPPSPSKSTPCRLLVSCTLPATVWSGQSALSPNLLPHGLRQACLLIAEDDSHFSLADINGAFEFKLLLKVGKEGERELFFSSFLQNPDLHRLTQQPANSQ